MAVLLLGATGNVGPHVARALLRRGDDVVRVLTRDAGRAADVRDSLLERGMPRWEAERFQEMYQLFRDRQSEFVTPDVEQVLGRPPRSVEDYLQGLVATVKT